MVVAVNEAFDTAVKLFEKKSVRAGPATPNSPEQRGDKKEAESEAADRKKKNPKVLCDECETKNIKPAAVNIEKNGGVAIDRNPRESHVNGEKNDGKKGAVAREGAADLVRMNDPMRTVLIHRAEGDKVEFTRFFGCFSHERQRRLE